jgi:hypothetical protein
MKYLASLLQMAFLISSLRKSSRSCFMRFEHSGEPGNSFGIELGMEATPEGYFNLGNFVMNSLFEI